MPFMMRKYFVVAENLLAAFNWIRFNSICELFFVGAPAHQKTKHRRRRRRSLLIFLFCFDRSDFCSCCAAHSSPYNCKLHNLTVRSPQWVRVRCVDRVRVSVLCLNWPCSIHLRIVFVHSNQYSANQRIFKCMHCVGVRWRRLRGKMKKRTSIPSILFKGKIDQGTYCVQPSAGNKTTSHLCIGYIRWSLVHTTDR